MPRKLTNREVFDKIQVTISNDLRYQKDIDYRKIYQRMKKKSKVVMDSLFITNKVESIEEVIAIMDKLDGFGKSTTKAKLMFVYGEEIGLRKWNNYVQKQSETNTFEYKQKKYGMTRHEFDLYNSNRASTLSNFIIRHGDEKGQRMWESYKDRQGYTNTEGHLGPKYAEVCRKKAHRFDVYVERYGDEEVARIRLDNHFKNIRCFYSKKSQELFDSLIANRIFSSETVYYAQHNYEYGIYDVVSEKYYRYDFVCTQNKICIEFHGDHYHGNPRLYKPDDLLKGRGMTQTRAKSVWERDKVKIDALRRERGITTIEVWEMDYNNDPELIVKRIADYVELYRQF